MTVFLYMCVIWQLERKEKEQELISHTIKSKEVFEKRFIYPWVVKGFVVRSNEHGYKGVAFVKHGTAEIVKEMDTSSGGGDKIIMDCPSVCLSD